MKHKKISIGLFSVLILTILFYSAIIKTEFHPNPADRVLNDSINIDKSKEIAWLQNKLNTDFIIKDYLFYIIASNLDEERTNELITETIGKATDCFYNNFFEKKPTQSTTIFLFKDDASYRYWAKELYNDDDLSRFGYYKPDERVMLMNINTGTGTLVHEMTHALVNFDFPDIPAWFNEGLGSLYERSSLNGNKLKGYINWRLPRLQDAINKDEYTSLKKLMNMWNGEFYGSKSDLNYAQARYFCMYLQEKGILNDYYHLFRDTFSGDKTGFSQAEKILGRSVPEEEIDFIQWVKGLKYE